MERTISMWFRGGETGGGGGGGVHGKASPWVKTD